MVTAMLGPGYRDGPVCKRHTLQQLACLLRLKLASLGVGRQVAPAPGTCCWQDESDQFSYFRIVDNYYYQLVTNIQVCQHVPAISNVNACLLLVQHWLNPLTAEICSFNPLSPHYALKHYFTSMKTHSIFLQSRVLERKFPLNWFTNTW